MIALDTYPSANFCQFVLTFIMTRGKTPIYFEVYFYSFSGQELHLRIDGEVRKQGGTSSTQTVSGEENDENKRYPSVQEVLNRIADKLVDTIDPSDPESINDFLQYMKEARQVLIVDVKTGSLIITVRCSSLHILDDLWKDYCTGHLQEVAQRYLVTEDILKELGLESVQLTLTINEEEYRAYRKHLLRNEGN